jgi:electron transport protein HydN
MNEGAYFVLADREKCTGCRACEVACFAAHRKAKPQTVGSVAVPLIPNLYLTRTERTRMPVQCHHCENAPCMQACLADALTRVDGTVMLKAGKCIGCRNCALACPFGAIAIIGAEVQPGGGLAHKCDLCAGQGEQACVAACPNKALRLVDTAEEVRSKRIRASESLETFVDCAKGGR